MLFLLLFGYHSLVVVFFLQDFMFRLPRGSLRAPIAAQRYGEVMGPPRPGKRVRSDELFFDSDVSSTGSYLKIKLTSGKPLKSKGWPWVQLGVRGILGATDRLEKANFLSDGSLLIKTKCESQTDKFLHTKSFAAEECEVVRDQRLNQSRGTIQAYDLLDLSEDEVVGWLGEFGVVGAKRFTRKINGKVENTATILLTFDRPSCPTKLQLDYVTYHVHQYVPNPMLCYRCGRFGHPEVRCQHDPICLQCGKAKHEGECTRWCVNCKKAGHSCLARDCEVWQKEKEICRIKVEHEVSYSQARQHYDRTHDPPVLKAYAAVARTPSAASKHDDELKDKVGRLEAKLGEMMSLLEQLLKKQTGSDVVRDVGEHVEVGPMTQQADPGTGSVAERFEDSDIQSDDVRSAIDAMSHESEDGQTVASVRGRGEPDKGEWQVQRGRRMGKSQGQAQGVGDKDAISPSPLITRSSRTADKAKQRVPRKSWKEGS